MHGLLTRLSGSLEPFGFTLRGGFHPRPEDHFPARADGRPARTAVVVGSAGGAMWEAFSASPPPAAAERNPLDAWIRPIVQAAARDVGGDMVYPTDGPPFPPIQQWAQRADTVYRSPLGIVIHPEFGLWHAYRAVIVLAERLDLPDRVHRPDPCAACADKPCLATCPVDAFKPIHFDPEPCADHVESAAGTVCRERGCMARRACPVGRAYMYPRAAQEFHTAAFVGAVRRRRRNPPPPGP